jgi:hypothetical protein
MLEVTVPDETDVLPALRFPLTINEVNAPTDVMFGCALVVTVPAVFAESELIADVAVPELAA